MSAVRARAPWLAINLGIAFLASGVISAFSTVIAEHVALASLMPVVAGLSGNVRIAALAVSVRAIAERDLDGPLARRAVRREALTAIINGVVIAAISALVVYIWHRDILLSLVIGTAMCLTFTWAGLVGILCAADPEADRGGPGGVIFSVCADLDRHSSSFFCFLGLASVILK